MKMSEPLSPLSSAKIVFYLIRAKLIGMLCNMFKQILLIIRLLQEFFNFFFQILDVLATCAQLVGTVY